MTAELTERHADSPDESSADTDPSGDGGPEDGSVVELPTQQGTARLNLPFHVTESEAAAVLAAVATHLAAMDDADEPEPTVDRWKLAGRLGGWRRAQPPDDCTHGDVWKLAGRCPSW